jgi:hypothetical protein
VTSVFIEVSRALTNISSYSINMTSTPVVNSIKQLWRHVGLDEAFVTPYLSLKGDADSTVPSSFKVGQLAQTTVALCGLAASLFHGSRNDSKPPKVEVDARHALLNFGEHSELLPMYTGSTNIMRYQQARVTLWLMGRSRKMCGIP